MNFNLIINNGTFLIEELKQNYIKIKKKKEKKNI